MPADDPPESPRPWLPGAVISVIGILIGSVSFVYFCYALGLNFQDEGWAATQPPQQTDPTALTLSLVGFSIAILVFWIGFFRTTHQR